MFDVKELIRLPDPKKSVRAEVREVIRDVRERPHVYIRVTLTGWHFPHRAEEPFMVVGKVVSERVLLSPDGHTARGYFTAALPAARKVTFGYGRTVTWDFSISINPRRIPRLDRKKLPKRTVDPFRR
jgi:hypothetical protein